MKIKPIRFLLIALLAGGLFTACSTSPEDDPGDPPTIPSTASMDIDYSGMQSTNFKTASQTDSTYIAALIAASITKVSYDALISIPKTLLEAAQNSEPEYIGNATWQWEYSASGEGASYSVRLTANTSREEVDWKFYVLLSSPAVTWDDVLLFSGSTTYDGSEGIWLIYNPTTEKRIVSTGWSIDETTTGLSMGIFPQGNDTREYLITYTFEGTTKTLVYYNDGEQSQTTIQWDTETGVGFLIAPNFNDGEQACWDENFQDTTCI